MCKFVILEKFFFGSSDMCDASFFFFSFSFYFDRARIMGSASDESNDSE